MKTLRFKIIEHENWNRALEELLSSRVIEKAEPDTLRKNKNYVIAFDELRVIFAGSLDHIENPTEYIDQVRYGQ